MLMLATYVVLVILLIMACAVLLGLLSRLLERLRLRRDKTVIAEYDAPKYLTPGELGYIVDVKFGDNEVLATVLDLAQKGYIKMVPHGAGDALLILGTVHDSELAGLGDSELTVISWVRRDHTRPVTWKSITHMLTKRIGDHESFHLELKNQLVSKGYIKRRSFFSAFGLDYAHLVATVMTLLLAFAALVSYQEYVETNFFGGYQAVLFSMASYVALPLIVVGWFIIYYLVKLAVYLYFVAAGRPLNMTALFRHRWRDVAGYQLFIRTVEFSRLDADTNPHDPAMPYAVALGFRPDMKKMMEYQR